jgi:hypothetical protein
MERNVINKLPPIRIYLASYGFNREEYHITRGLDLDLAEPRTNGS